MSGKGSNRRHGENIAKQRENLTDIYGHSNYDVVDCWHCNKSDKCIVCNGTGKLVYLNGEYLSYDEFESIERK